MNHYFLTFSTSQVRPSSKPYWVLAEQAVIVHFLVLICYIFKFSRIFHKIIFTSSGCKACTRSCLLAKINKGTSASYFYLI